MIQFINGGSFWKNRIRKNMGTWTKSSSTSILGITINHSNWVARTRWDHFSSASIDCYYKLKREQVWIVCYFHKLLKLLSHSNWNSEIFAKHRISRNWQHWWRRPKRYLHSRFILQQLCCNFNLSKGFNLHLWTGIWGVRFII